MALHVVLLGPPACGKGTQGHMLAKAAGAAYFSTGKQLRRELEAGTRLGDEARPFLDAGQYVPDAMALQLALNWLEDVEAGWILDGFPRTLAQAQELDSFLGPARDGLQAVLLDVPTGELERRVGVRRECVKCAWVGTRSEAEASGTCPACGGSLRRREDDSADHFRKRLVAFEELTKPAVAHYEESDRLHRVQGSGSPEEVFALLQDSLRLP